MTALRRPEPPTGRPDEVGPRVGIRLRATVIATVVVAVTLLVGGVLLVALVHRSLVSSLDAAGGARARDVAALAASGRLQRTVASAGEDSSVVQVVDATGSVLAASANIDGEPAMLASPPADGRNHLLTRSGLPIGDSSQPFRIVVLPVGGEPGRAAGPAWVYVATSLRQVDAATAKLGVLLLVGLPVILAVVAAVTRQAVGRALRPVGRIQATAAAVSATNPQARVPVPRTGDEISDLAQTMNAMLDRLQSAATRQQQFVGDAAHELRSPVAALQAELDVAAAFPDGQPTAALMSRLSAQTRRLAVCIDDLLFLARVDEQVAPAADEVVDLDELVLAEAARLRSEGVSVGVAAVSAIRMRGRAAELARMLRNLGDNAAEHAVTTVTLGLTVSGTDALLGVCDDGPGVAVADRERIFERFTRLDGARARPRAGGGTGLGLAICRHIAQRHGGSLVVEPAPGGAGAMFSVRLPLV